MSFAVPWALLGLLGIPLLILLERLRRRPRPHTWPSLLLWRGLGEEVSARRRRVEALLVYECLAVLLLSLAAAEPAFESSRTERIVTVLLDAGPHMDARRLDGSTAREATLAELDRIADAGEVRRIEVTGDLRAHVAAADQATVRVLATSQEGVAGEGYLVIGRAPEGDNIGIDAVEVRGDRLWFALACDGDDREVRLRIGNEERRFATGVGHTIAFASELEIVEADNYDGDDLCRLRRFRLAARNETGSRFIDAALFKAGVPAGQGGDLVVRGERAGAGSTLVRGADCIAEPGIFEGLFLDECAWRGVADVEGRPLLRHRGRIIASWSSASTLTLGMPVDRDWDEQGTLAVLINRAKRERIEALLADGERLVGEAVASPAPGFVETRGVDRPWDGILPDAEVEVAGAVAMRAILGAAALVVLLLYLRALLRRAE